MQSTFESKLNTTEMDLAVLMAQAGHMARLERKLFVDLYVRELDRNLLKRKYISDHGITARQFNAIRINVDGKVGAWRAAEERTIDTLVGKHKATQKTLKNLQADLGKQKRDDARERIRFGIHQKKRKLGNLEDRIAVHRRRLEGAPSICFGSRDLFRRQFNLAENGYARHEQWLADWRFARASQFLNIGSRGETLGSQTCQYNPSSRTLSIRLAATAIAINGGNEHVCFNDVTFGHGQAQIEAAIALGTAVTTRIVLRQDRRGAIGAYALVTVEEVPAQLVSNRFLGRLGVDLNARTVALAWIRPDGNIERADSIDFNLHRKSGEQSTSILSSVVQDVVMRAAASKVPLVCERLDFSAKKKSLGETGKRYAAMLSGFAYAQFYKLLLRCAARHGVEVITVNPAFTSILGWIKFGVDRLTVDEAAAAAIGRRGMRCHERLRSRSMSPALRTKLMQVQEEAHMRHVWTGWRRLSSWLGRSRKDWPGRCFEKKPSAGKVSPAVRSTNRKERRPDLPHQPVAAARLRTPASVVAPGASDSNCSSLIRFR